MNEILPHLEFMFSGELYQYLECKRELKTKAEFDYLVMVMTDGTLPGMCKITLEEVDYMTGEPIDLMTQLINRGFYESKSEMYRLMKDNSIKINGKPLQKDSVIDDFPVRIAPGFDTLTYVLKTGKKDYKIFFIIRD